MAVAYSLILAKCDSDVKLFVSLFLFVWNVLFGRFFPLMRALSGWVGRMGGSGDAKMRAV